MPGEVARRFHDATKHTWRSVRSRSHSIDWAIQPAPYKIYTSAPMRRLSVDLEESDWPALDSMSGDGPVPRGWLDAAWLTSMLFYVGGVTRRWERDGQQTYFRAAASVGALYPVEIYVVVGELGKDRGEQLSAGVYHFEPFEFALRRLRDGDHRAALAVAAAAPELASKPLTMVLTGIPWRSSWKYGSRGYRHMWWDAGAMTANALAMATAHGLTAETRLGFVDNDVSSLLGLDPQREIPLALVSMGEPVAPRQMDVNPSALKLPSWPYNEPNEHPLIDEVHQAGDAPNEMSVRGWRERMRKLGLASAVQPRTPPLPIYDTMEAAILLRGATRRFEPEATAAHLDRDGLTWLLDASAAPLHADWLNLGDASVRPFLTIHNVRGVEAGAYSYGPDGLELLRPGRFRDEARNLCLEQELGGSGDFTLFHGANLERALAAGGDRAYRVVQFEGGIAAGRAQLAAAALGTGATGLTFYDDDITHFFDAGHEPMVATAIGQPAYAPRMGRRPGEMLARR